MDLGVPVALGGRLPADPASNRVGEPDILIRSELFEGEAAGGGCLPVDVKHHKTLDPKENEDAVDYRAGFLKHRYWVIILQKLGEQWHPKKINLASEGVQALACFNAHGRFLNSALDTGNEWWLLGQRHS